MGGKEGEKSVDEVARLSLICIKEHQWSEWPFPPSAKFNCICCCVGNSYLRKLINEVGLIECWSGGKSRENWNRSSTPSYQRPWVTWSIYRQLVQNPGVNVHTADRRLREERQCAMTLQLLGCKVGGKFSQIC